MSDYLAGTAAFLANVASVQKNVKAAQKRGLIAAGALVLNASTEIVPYEDGDFSRTGRVTVDDEGRTVAVSYKDVRYNGEAIILHEDMEMKHDDERSAKFLEKAMTQSVDGVRTILGNNLKTGMF